MSLNLSTSENNVEQPLYREIVLAESQQVPRQERKTKVHSADLLQRIDQDG